MTNCRCWAFAGALLLVAVTCLPAADLVPEILRLPGATPVAAPETEKSTKPNFIIIFVDDLGYGDLGCFGSELIRTPNLDHMAREGMTFDNFYAQNVCGPSRSALLTGCYPLRNAKKENRVTPHPFLHLKEITIAEVLKPLGYATACLGKWDQAGHSQTKYDPALMPNKQGFDYFFGTPSSNDRIIRLLENEKVIEEQASMATITQRLTDKAIGFIKANREKPFFVYLPHPMPHLRLSATEKFKGKSTRGLYGDVVEELDHNVGRVISELKTHGLDKNTYVVFTSDNGPWYLEKSVLKVQRDKGGSHGGDAGPLRGHKTTAWEGGSRVPCIIWAPGRVPAGSTCSEITRTLDFLPTMARLAGAQTPDDRILDGQDITALIHGVEGVESPSNSFLYYTQTQLHAVRRGVWKLHLPSTINAHPKWDIWAKDSDLVDHTKPLLYNLKEDIGETTNIADKHPEIVAELMRLAEAAREDIGDYNRIGKGARFFDPQPRRPDIARAAEGN